MKFTYLANDFHNLLCIGETVNRNYCPKTTADFATAGWARTI